MRAREKVAFKVTICDFKQAGVRYMRARKSSGGHGGQCYGQRLNRSGRVYRGVAFRAGSFVKSVLNSYHFIKK